MKDERIIESLKSLKRDTQRNSFANSPATNAELDRIREAILILSEKMFGIKINN